MKPRIPSVLSDCEVASLAEMSLGILEAFGVRLDHVAAVDYLINAGAKRGDDGRIRVAADLARRILGNAPRQFRLFDRRGGSIEIGTGRSWTMCGGTVAQVAQWPDGSLRSATRKDVADFARLSDALPLVHCVVPMVEAQDVGREKAEAMSFAETLAHTTKFVFACPIEHRAARAFVEMGRIAAGSQDLSEYPKIGFLVTLLPGLRLDDDCAATTILAAQEGLPLIVMGSSIAGQSAPNTVAAASAMKMAANLFVAILAQVVRPATPVLIDCGVTVLDMNTADIGEAGPEYPLGVAAMAQVARQFHESMHQIVLEWARLFVPQRHGPPSLSFIHDAVKHSLGIRGWHRLKM